MASKNCYILSGGYIGVNCAFTGTVHHIDEYNKIIEHLKQVLKAIEPSKADTWGHRGIRIDTWMINGVRVLEKGKSLTIESLQAFEEAEARAAQCALHA